MVFLNGPNLTPAQLEALLKLTSQRLGTTPESLKQAAESGQLSGMLGDAPPALQQALASPQAAQELLASPQAQKLLRLLQKGGS